MAEEKYLIDANSFIAPYRTFYAFDLVPTYWEELSSRADTGRVILLDMVKGEIDRGSDQLSEWLNQQEGIILCNHKTSEIINQYSEVINYLATSGYYHEQALRKWAQNDVADPWLIAAAKVHGYTIITAEVSAGGLSVKNLCKNAKIPDVANAMGVKTNNLFYMMRQLKIKI